ncbi:MAG: asparagine synthase-related protein [Acidobacteriota bacterium]|nr:asparagine synthase-related protein [Acidobacteriota bacterium]
MRIVERTELPNIFWKTDAAAATAAILAAGCKTPVLGRFALAHSDDDAHYLIRDRLGLNKLFFHLDRKDRVLTAGNFIHEVARATGDYANVFSVPPAHYVRVDRRSLEVSVVRYYDMQAFVDDLPDLDPEAFRAKVDAILTGVFSEIPGRFPDARFLVCLSGGLDSTIVAAYAKRSLPGVEAVTFSYSTPGRNPPGVYTRDELARLDPGDPLLSEDFHSARKIADALAIPFNAVLCDKSIDTEVLREVLVHAQDWRDFNVHCAWVNDRIGAAIRRARPGESLVVITGDLMNEFLADYTPVEYDGTEYYPQPKVSKTRRRDFFVYGLEAGDREIGVFHRHGIVTVQPYAALAELYLGLPGETIEPADAKEKLNGPLIADSTVRELVGRVKVRAQVGGAEGGTLGLFHERGIDQDALLETWLSIFTPLTRGKIEDDLVTTGRYRMMGS